MVITNAFGSATSAVAVLTVYDLADALNANLPWATAGNAPWFGVNQYPNYFTPAARSGAITNNQSSSLQTTVSGPGTFGFQWKVSSQPDLDCLIFSINGVEQKRISGTVDWSKETYYLPAGAQNLQWVYAKGVHGSAGQDAGWLDWVTFASGAILPTITTQPLHQALTSGSNITFSVSAYGTPPLSYQWQCNGVDIAGATTNALTLFNVQPMHAGRYRALVSNPYGTTASSEASLFTVVGPPQPQDALDRWYLRDTAQLSKVRFVGGRFIGLGANGTLITSPDGAVWTPRDSDTMASLCGATCGTLTSPVSHNLFVLVGTGGTILTSGDGTNWARISVTSQNLNEVTWNGSRFVATATANAAGQPNVFYSANGTNWVGATFPSNPDSGFPFVTSAIGTAGSYFIAAGGSQFAYNIWRSATGSSWQYVGFSDQVVGGIAAGNGRTLMVGWEGWPRLSTDQGANWSVSASSVITSNAYQPPFYAIPMVGSDIAFGNGTFLVARSFLRNGFLTTTDGVTWSKRPLFVDASIDSVAYGNSTFVVLCSGGAYPAGIYQSEPVATPMITAGIHTNPKALRLTISGEIGRPYRLQTSSNLKVWNDRCAYTNTMPTFQLLDPVEPGSARLFYRAVSP